MPLPVDTFECLECKRRVPLGAAIICVHRANIGPIENGEDAYEALKQMASEKNTILSGLAEDRCRVAMQVSVDPEGLIEITAKLYPQGWRIHPDGRSEIFQYEAVDIATEATAPY